MPRSHRHPHRRDASPRHRIAAASLVVAAALVAGPASGPRAAEPAAKAPLKVAFAYVGPVGDAGWTFAHDKARKAVEAEYKGKIVTSYVENVPEAADAERVLRDMVTQGNTLIFGTTFGYMVPMMKVAGESKGVKFEHATGYKTAPNLRTYDSRTYEGAYLAGVVAGGMTKSNVLGVVASIPIPEVIRNIDSFTQQMTLTRITSILGAFVLGGVLVASTYGAEAASPSVSPDRAGHHHSRLAHEVGHFQAPMVHKYGPNAHLGSAVIDWSPYYKKAVGDALAGTWTTGQVWWGVKEGAIDLVALSSKVPAPLKAKVDAVKKGLKDGTFAIWKGPIADQAGKEVLKANQVADDKFLHGVNFYVKGVKGKPPKG